MEQTNAKHERFVLVSLAITFVLITAGAIWLKINPLRVLPLYISLVVMYLQTRINRFAFLLGGINSLFYAVVSYSFGLYASAAQCVLISFPLQIISFRQWQKNAYGVSAVFRRMSKQLIAAYAAASVLLYGGCCAVFSLMGAKLVWLDVFLFVLSIVVSVQNMLRYVEYMWGQVVSGAMTLVMDILVFLQDTDRFPFAIYSVFSLVCVVVTAKNVLALYRKQQKEQQERQEQAVTLS